MELKLEDGIYTMTIRFDDLPEDCKRRTTP
jgi:hypothetical protein